MSEHLIDDGLKAGTRLASALIPVGGESDLTATHYAWFGQGGLRTLNSWDEVGDIPWQRRELGMLVYVANLGRYYKLVKVAPAAPVNEPYYIDGTPVNGGTLPVLTRAQREANLTVSCFELLDVSGGEYTVLTMGMSVSAMYGPLGPLHFIDGAVTNSPSSEAGSVVSLPVGFKKEGAVLKLYFTNSGGSVRVSDLSLSIGDEVLVLDETLIIQGGTHVGAPQVVQYPFTEAMREFFMHFFNFGVEYAKLNCDFVGGGLVGSIFPSAVMAVGYPENYVEFEDYDDGQGVLDVSEFYQDLMLVWDCNWVFLTQDQVNNPTETGIRVDIPDNVLGKNLVVVMPKFLQDEKHSALLGVKIPNILDFSLYPASNWMHTNPYDSCVMLVYFLEQQFLGGKKAFWLVG